ncbi:MAG: glycosyltransferase family 4 protein [Lachnospiraceae bacterium]|nr:glycosyltransferase family 4 protein [Lachnospiraceae bacterium]
MKILWLCNVMLPAVAEQFHIEASNKEGWLSGLADVMLKKQEENNTELAVAFPAPAELLTGGEEFFERQIPLQGSVLTGYGFREDVARPDRYDEGLERRMRQILERCRPDVVHIFGTEYPHTLAMCRVFPDKRRLLITIQGLCSVYANAYFADLPGRVKQMRTFRDLVKRDSILQQQEKFERRGKMEIEAVKLAGNIGGRTEWDRFYTGQWNPDAKYYVMKETLRSNFYEDRWSRKNCEEHSVFLSQGDYPIKGLHYMLLALPEILKEYPDTHVYVAGAGIAEYKTLKQKIKISAYGRYLRELIIRGGLADHVTFLGRLDSEQMKERYLKSHLFVCCSSIENSPNSLGEAMLLGMPCVSADVGGIPSIFTDGEDGLLYPGFRSPDNAFDRLPENAGSIAVGEGEEVLLRNAQALAKAVAEIWRDEKKQAVYCENARVHALRNHNREENYRSTMEVYSAIVSRD